MANSAEYGLGPSVFPRGWFLVAESGEVGREPRAVRFFGRDFALYRGESGRPVLLDAYCPHMGTHLAKSQSAMIVQDGQQIEGDCIRCPYHGWRFGPDGQCNDIPYHDGPIPRSAALRSYPVKDVMGCVMVWFDPEAGEPDYEAPFLPEWDDSSWVRWELDHLGEIDVHAQEVLDNMADVRHLGPTHGAPCEYFENEFDGHVCIQRQGGWHKKYNAMLRTVTWYTGPGILLSKQQFGDALTYELIANTPVEDGKTRLWHACLSKGSNPVATAQDIAAAKMIQAGALASLASDLDVWRYKRSAAKMIQLPTDGPFATVRKWYKQFFDARENTAKHQQGVNGVYQVRNFPVPDDEARQLETGLKFR